MKWGRRCCSPMISISSLHPITTPHVTPHHTSHHTTGHTTTHVTPHHRSHHTTRHTTPQVTPHHTSHHNTGHTTPHVTPPHTSLSHGSSHSCVTLYSVRQSLAACSVMRRFLPKRVSCLCSGTQAFYSLRHFPANTKYILSVIKIRISHKNVPPCIKAANKIYL